MMTIFKKYPNIAWVTREEHHASLGQKKNHRTTEVDKVANLKEQVKDNTPIVLSQGESDLLEMLKESKQTRFDLRMGLKTSDKMVRKHIRELRQKGYPICSNSQCTGYWLGDDKDVQTTIAEYHSRILEMLEAVEGLNKSLMNCPFEHQECKYLCESCGKCRK